MEVMCYELTTLNSRNNVQVKLSIVEEAAHQYIAGCNQSRAREAYEKRSPSCSCFGATLSTATGTVSSPQLSGAALCLHVHMPCRNAMRLPEPHFASPRLTLTMIATLLYLCLPDLTS